MTKKENIYSVIVVVVLLVGGAVYPNVSIADSGSCEIREHVKHSTQTSCGKAEYAEFKLKCGLENDGLLKYLLSLPGLLTMWLFNSC